MLLNTLDDLKEFTRNFLGNLKLPAVVGLSGPLGAGKTTFVRQIIQELAQKNGVTPPKITSPTYVIHQSYPNFVPPIEHFDLYRLENCTTESLIELGYFDALERTEQQIGIIFIEWPEQSKDLKVLQLTHHLNWQITDTNTRKITINQIP